jgi:hypothetical protein
MRAFRATLLVAVCGAAISLSALTLLPAPWAWIAFLGSGAAVALAFRRRERRGARVLLALCAALLAWGVGEVAGALRAVEPRFTIEPLESDFVQLGHPVLGYRPKPGGVRRVIMYVGEQRIYDATYTIGPDGLRVTPRAAAPEGSLLCFGDSFTYGEGLQDEETWPSRAAESLGDRLQVHNLAFSGYGPHQMLSALERAHLEGLLAAPPRAAVYLAITDHVPRVAGMGGWDPSGPCYVLDAGGRLRFAGTFEEARRAGLLRETGTAAGNWIRRQVAKSNVFGRLAGGTPYGPDEVALFAEVVRRAEAEVRARWPGCAFHVLLWDNWRGVNEELLPALQSRGLEVHLASSILPGFPAEKEAYRISAHETHPNAKAAAILGRYVAERIAGP